jgi:hypothetical protein
MWMNEAYRIYAGTPVKREAVRPNGALPNGVCYRKHAKELAIG